MNVLIGVTGSIAVYKACELSSCLVQNNHNVRVVMTDHALNFIGKPTFESITGHKVYDKLFNNDKGIEKAKGNVHIDLSVWADVFLLAPATANIIGKIAGGIADDLLSTIALSVDCPIIIAPAMNEKMYLNKIVQGNINKLKDNGYLIIEPEEGYLACGYKGKGRLADIAEIQTILEGFESK